MRVFIKSIFWLISVFMYRIKIYGKENIPKEGAVLICPNHVHGLDSAVIIAHSKRKINVLAKAELFTGGIREWFADLFGIFPIKQDAADIDAIKTSLKILKNDEPLMIFPEGTRNGMAKGAPLKNGPIILAIKSGTPIIPVGIKGNFKFWSRIIIHIGKPISYGGYKDKIKDKEFITNLTKELMDEVVRLRDM